MSTESKRRGPEVRPAGWQGSVSGPFLRMLGPLRLEVRKMLDADNSTGWRWSLSTSTGTFLHVAFIRCDYVARGLDSVLRQAHQDAAATLRHWGDQ